MYWQVYLHKTVVAAEYMLIYTLRMAKELVKNGEVIFASSALKFFLENDIKQEDFEQNPKVLDFFAQLDDYDILGAIKEWQNNSDEVLSILSKALVNRKLFKIEISKEPFSKARIEIVACAKKRCAGAIKPNYSELIPIMCRDFGFKRATAEMKSFFKKTIEAAIKNNKW